MSKELYFTDGNNEVKYLDTTASFNLAITQDGSAFDLTNATAIDVKVANDTGYVFDKSIDMATIKQPLAGLITMPVDAEVMNALVPDDYTIEVWVTLSSLVTPGSQEGLTDTGSTTTTATPTTTATTPTTTYNAIFPSDDPQGFTITENVMSDSGDVIPVMSLDTFQQEFEQLKTDLTNKVATLQGPKGDKGDKGDTGTVDNTGLISAPAFQSLQTQVDNSAVGTNLYTDTKNFDNLASWNAGGPNPSNFWTKTTDTYNGLAVMQTTQDWNGLSQYIQVKKGDILTYSVYAKYTSGTGTSSIPWALNNQIEGSYSTATTNQYSNIVTITDSWQRVSGTIVATSDGYLRPRIERTNSNTNTLQIAGIKLEEGSVATDWCPNPAEILTKSDYAKIKAAIVALGGALS
ncbi:collagen-like protein [Levilactobacillus brevis]|uniref:collagen-like protein n=1 Tax=Levilactobacillus brevis TaxID=1580 RepID=UPI003F4ABFA0